MKVHMDKIPAGFSGFFLSLIIFLVLWASLYRARRKIVAYNLDPKGIEGAFEPLLAKYLRLAEVLVSLATGSIVLIVGSTALRSGNTKLPWVFASPLILLAFSAIYGIAFMAWLTLSYEEYQQGNKHTGFVYSLSETLGYSSIVCFFFGYLGLIWMVTR